MSRSATRLGVVFLSWLVAGTALAGGEPPPPVREALDLRATQVTLAIDRDGRHRPFRATVLAINGDVLTVMTAARFVATSDEGRPVRLFNDEGATGAIEGRVLVVARNPAYRTGKANDIPRNPNVWPDQRYRHNFAGPLAGKLYRGRSGLPYPFLSPDTIALHNRVLSGADNAIAEFLFLPRPGSGREPVDRVLRALRPAPPLARSTYPGPLGGAVAARMVDRDGREHAVRAGNFENPRLLEWGHGFEPKAGDIGGGVFVLHEGADEPPELFLIGIITGSDQRGGSASLVARDMPWLADALREVR